MRRLSPAADGVRGGAHRRRTRSAAAQRRGPRSLVRGRGPVTARSRPDHGAVAPVRELL